MFRPTKNHAIGFGPAMLGLIVGITLGLSNLASAEFLFAEIPFDGVSFDRLMGRDALPLHLERLPDLDFVAQTETGQAGQQADIQAGAVELGKLIRRIVGHPAVVEVVRNWSGSSTLLQPALLRPAMVSPAYGRLIAMAAIDPDSEDSASETAEEPERPAFTPLSEELKTVRGQLRRTAADGYKRVLDTGNHTVADMLQASMTYGCDTEMVNRGRRVSTFGGIGSDYLCGGYSLFREVDGQLVPQVGYGTQSSPGQFLAVLGFSRVPHDYPVEAGQTKADVQAIVDYEKRACRREGDQSGRLIGLARYVPSNESWENESGETFSVPQLVRQVLYQPDESLAYGGTWRLLALSYALKRRQICDEPVNGIYAKVDTYMKRFQDHALSLQNKDGTWHRSFFEYRGNGGSPTDQLYSTGHILRWLVYSLPEERLRDPEMVQSVRALIRLLPNTNNLSDASSREIDARFAALSALVLYDQRVFRPHDEAEATEKSSEPSGKELAGKAVVAR